MSMCRKALSSYSRCIGVGVQQAVPGCVHVGAQYDRDSAPHGTACGGWLRGLQGASGWWSWAGTCGNRVRGGYVWDGGRVQHLWLPTSSHALHAVGVGGSCGGPLVTSNSKGHRRDVQHAAAAPGLCIYIHNAEDSSMVGTVLPAFNVVRPASPHLGDTLCRFSCQHQWLRISRHMVVLTAVGKRVVCCSCCCTVACMVCWAAGHMGVCVVPCMASHALWSWLPADSCWY